MADRITVEQRSSLMSKIKGTNTTPELTVRRFLYSKGFRYRIHVKDLPGKPDIVLKKYNTIININGCFFHGHNYCKYSNLPKTNVEFWRKKIEGNKIRDIKNNDLLMKFGWNIITIWECELKKSNIQQTLDNIVNNLNNSYLKKDAQPQ